MKIPKQMSAHLCVPMCVQSGHVGGLAQSCLGSDARREWGTISSSPPPPSRDESNVGGKLVLHAVSCGSSHFSMAGLSSYLPTSLHRVHTSGTYTTLIHGNQMHIL